MAKGRYLNEKNLDRFERRRGHGAIRGVAKNRVQNILYIILFLFYCHSGRGNIRTIKAAERTVSSVMYCRVFIDFMGKLPPVYPSR
jgi:hypothetical protein